jgi:hypothetical protein
LPKVIEAGFQEWRDQRDLTAWKYAMWDANAKMPTQMPNGRRGASVGRRSILPTCTGTP